MPTNSYKKKIKSSKVLSWFGELAQLVEHPSHTNMVPQNPGKKEFGLERDRGGSTCF